MNRRLIPVMLVVWAGLLGACRGSLESPRPEAVTITATVSITPGLMNGELTSVVETGHQEPTLTFNPPNPSPTRTLIHAAATEPTREGTVTTPQVTRAEVTVVPTSIPLPGEPAQVAAEWLDVWDDPQNEKSYWHRVTQLVLGEQVRVLSVDGDWAQIAAVEQPSSLHELGYPGWVRREGLVAGERDAGLTAVVMRRYTFLRQSPHSAALLDQRLNLDTRLPVLQVEGGWAELALPAGGTGWAPVTDLRLAENPDQPVDLDGIWQVLDELAGIPYLWGGTTGHALDCSGLTYRVFHAYGIRLARDAHDQADLTVPVEAGGWQPLDLLFFRDAGDGPVTHVGIYTGKQDLFDANPFLGTSRHALSEMAQWYVWYGARRMVLP